MAASPVPNALPTNGQVVAGNATISQTQTATAATMNVNQASQRAVINWDSFNVGKNATVNFNQPNASAVTLNRVTGPSASVIEGAVKANGQVIFVNPNGVTFAKGSQVDAAGVVATTMNISDKDFMDGKSTYKGNGTGAVVNEGKIKTNVDGGYIALLAPEVRNDGYLIAKKGAGTVVMGSGEQITLDFKGNSLISLKVDAATYNGLVENKRVVEVNGGLVVVAAGSANQLMASVIQNTGKISASSMVSNGGVIELVANTVTQAGKVTANSQTAQGGQINIVGNDITVASNSKTTATGATTGGQVNIGLASTKVAGGTQVNAPTQAGIKANADAAANTKQLANTVTIEKNALVDASATQSGSGGSIAIWSQAKTTVAGILKAMGGAISGNGGFIETSSKGSVILTATAQINTSAANGQSGTWLLDPIDLTIDANAANVISAALSNNNVTITVTNNTTACSVLGACTQNGTGNLTIASGADILKTGSSYTTLTLSSAGIFNLNANIRGQNLDVIISSSIAYLNVGSSINASKVTVQAQIINAAGAIHTSPYSLADSSNSLGNLIQLLAQAIYVSGGLTANTSLGRAGSINLTANSITLNPGATIEANGEEGGLVTIAANDSLWSGATIQANGSNGGGGTLSINAANDLYFSQAGLQANGTRDGGAITLIAATGELSIQNSTIQTNGSSGRGGSIGISALNNVTFSNVAVEATGFTQGGSIKTGNDASNGTLPFALSTTLDQYTTLNASQLDPNSGNQAGGFIETSGHALSVLSSINAGRGGMWLLDPVSLNISGAQNINGNSSVISSTLNAALGISAVTIVDSAGDITIDGSISGANSLTIIASAGNIQVNAGIQLTGAGSSLVLKASGYISTKGPNTFQTNGGDIIFWSNTSNVNSSGATSANFIFLDIGTKLLTSGGALYLAGGLSSPIGTTTANGNLYPTGYAFAGTQTIVTSGTSNLEGVSSGILLGPYRNSGTPIIIRTAGGDVVIAGQATTNMPGFSTQASFLIDSGTGTISIAGISHGGNGIELTYGASDANVVITSSSTLANAIKISGVTDCGSCVGFWATNNSTVNTAGVLIQATGSGGAITISGENSGSGSGSGVFLSGMDILAASGSIFIVASKLATESRPVFVGACIGTSAPCANFTVGTYSYLPYTSSSANVIFNVNVVGGFAGVLTVNTTGTLLLAPELGGSWANGFAWSGTNTQSGGVTTFTADASSTIQADGKFIVQNITGLTIGAPNSTGTVNIKQDLSPFGNITIYGGDISINADLSGLHGNMTLVATTGDITINGNATWGSASTVTFNAFGNININGQITPTYLIVGTPWMPVVPQNIYVLLNPGSSIYGSTPTLTYGIFNDAGGLSPTTLALVNLITGSVQWSGSTLNANTSVGAYSLSYVSGLLISDPTYHLISGNAKTWTIAPKPITITDNAVSATYNANTSYATLVSNAGYTLSAPLVGSDSIGALNQAITVGGSLATGIAQPGTFVSAPGSAVLNVGNANNYAFSYASTSNTVAQADVVSTPAPPPVVAVAAAPPPVYIPPPVIVALVAPLPPPVAAPPMLVVTTAPTGGDGVAPPPGQAPPPVRAVLATVASDGTISFGAAPPPAPPVAPPPAANNAPNSGNSSSTTADGKSSGNKNTSGNPERGSKNEAIKLAALKEGADKAGTSKTANGKAAAPKYVGKYANGFRAAEKTAAKGSPKEAASKPSTSTAKAAPPREGKYSARINAMANSGAVSAPLVQAQFNSQGLPPLPGVPASVAMPIVLRGGDSLAQSYDDVPSIRNSGVANVGRSKNTENYHESLESVNLMSTLNLFIIH